MAQPLVKVILLIPSLEENLIQPEYDPNQADNQQSNQYGDNQIRHASSAFIVAYPNVSSGH